MNKLNAVICAAMLSFASTAALSAATDLPSAEAIEAMTAGATVTAVDKAKRTYTVTGKNGKSHTFTAGAEMQNFDQIKVGDKIDASYVEEASISVDRAGMKPIFVEQTKIARADKGGRPGMIITKSAAAVGVITAIDHKNPSVTIKGPLGKENTFIVPGVAKGFKDIKKGDNVMLTREQVLTIADVAPDTYAPAKK
jgi:hypothetical protein